MSRLVRLGGAGVAVPDGAAVRPLPGACSLLAEGGE